MLGLERQFYQMLFFTKRASQIHWTSHESFKSVCLTSLAGHFLKVCNSIVMQVIFVVLLMQAIEAKHDMQIEHLLHNLHIIYLIFLLF